MRAETVAEAEQLKGQRVRVTGLNGKTLTGRYLRDTEASTGLFAVITHVEDVSQHESALAVYWPDIAYLEPVE